MLLPFGNWYRNVTTIQLLMQKCYYDSDADVEMLLSFNYWCRIITVIQLLMQKCYCHSVTAEIYLVTDVEMLLGLVAPELSDVDLFFTSFLKCSRIMNLFWNCLKNNGFTICSRIFGLITLYKVCWRVTTFEKCMMSVDHRFCSIIVCAFKNFFTKSVHVIQ